MKIKYILVICFSLLYGIVINEIYRPYIHESNLKANFITNSGNNLIFIPFSYAFCCLIRGKNFYSLRIDILLNFLFLTSLEIFSYFFPILGTYDSGDILALGIGGLTTILIFKKNENKK